MELMPPPDRKIPSADLVSGQKHRGRVTLWTVRCTDCNPMWIGDPTSKKRASEILLQHYKDHRNGVV